MSFDRSWPHGLAGLSMATLLSLTPAAARAGDTGAAPAVSQAKGEEIDAEMLRDLELLSNPDYARDREIAKRMSFLERMRALQALPWANNQPPPAGTPSPAGPAKAR
jgi:hypothetical protein